MQHLSYPGNPSVQMMGTEFVVKKLRNARSQDHDDSEEEDDRGQDDDRSRDDDDNRNQDDDSSREPPYSPSPRPRRRPVMSTMFGNWKKLIQHS